MAHDREFQRKRKDTRMPVRDSHGEDQPAARQTEQDFDLRRARDTPSSVNGKTHRQDIPVQTEFSHLSPETPASLLEQGEAYATALDGFRNTLRHRMLPGQRPRYRTTCEAISGRRLPDVFL